MKLIIDTDIGPDCDDAGALACAHSLMAEGRCELVAVTHCTSNAYGAGCVDAINRWYGRGAIPVGTLRRAGFLSQPEHTKYNRHIASTYPNRYPTGDGVPDAVSVLRATLAAAEDRGVTVCAIGPLVNLADLLASGPDGFSPLHGRELVERKVRLLVDMGGGETGPEWNFQMDPAAAAEVCRSWPGEIWFTTHGVGATIITGKNWPEGGGTNPIRDAYRLYAPQGRMSWDQTAVWAAVMGPEPYFGLTEPGRLEVVPDGANVWHHEPGALHRRIRKIMSDDEIAGAIDSLMGCRKG